MRCLPRQQSFWECSELQNRQLGHVQPPVVLHCLQRSSETQPPVKQNFPGPKPGSGQAEFRLPCLRLFNHAAPSASCCLTLGTPQCHLYTEVNAPDEEPTKWHKASHWLSSSPSWDSLPSPCCSRRRAAVSKAQLFNRRRFVGLATH